MMPRFGKSLELSAIAKTPAKMQEKSPAMFSINSLAFWMSCSTTHIAGAPSLELLLAACDSSFDSMINYNYNYKFYFYSIYYNSMKL